MNYFLKSQLFLFISFFTLLTSAQEIPPIELYKTDDYFAGNQNWMISQTADKQIYIANNEGLLEFNGASWKLYPSPNNTIIRSVNVVDDFIYTGCFMEFGYWKKDEYGNFEYFSLSEKLDEKMIEDEQIWNIISIDNWILFQSLNRIYVYNTINNKFYIINAKNQIKKIYKLKNTIYYFESNRGIFQIKEGKPILFINNEYLKGIDIINIFNYKNQLLLLSRKNGFYFYKDNRIKKWNISGNSLIDSTVIYSAIQLNDASFILGTISNGIIHLSESGTILYQIDQSNGLSNNTVLSLFVDYDYNLWLGLDNGINTINLKSPITLYKDYKGVIGTVYCSTVYNDNLYLGSNQGLFYKKFNSTDEFKLYKDTNGQVWSLDIIDNKLFCGHHSGTYIIDNNSVKLLASEYGTWSVKKIPNNPDLLLQGTYDGFYVLKKENNNWKIRNKIKGFNISTRSFEYTSDTNLIVNHEYKGLYHVTIDKEYSKVTKSYLDSTINKGKNSGIIAHKNKILYANKEGIFVYSKKEKSFKKERILSKLINNENYISGKLVVDKTNNLWLFAKRYIYHITPNQLNEKPKINSIPISNILRKGNIGFENISQVSEHEYLIGKSNGYIKLDLSKIQNKDYSVNLSNVYYKARENMIKYVSFEKVEILKNKQNDIHFSYCVPQYDKYLATEYQYKLEGLDDRWSNFSTESKILFKNLRYNDYNFKLKARVGNTLTNTTSLKFKIDKPWYLSNLFFVIYFLTTIALILLIHKTHKYYYNKQYKHNLLKNKQLITSIKNEKLNQDIKSRNNELAISTMSLIKKNEVLSKIKHELIGTDKEKNISVIKLINKNLNDEKDWEFFEKAFNNADKNFMHNIKKAHPKLTPNDLRFCAFLRLNITSKELAPLLNISYRSVEIKRYRLRKKMNLSAKNSLISHILEF